MLNSIMQIEMANKFAIPIQKFFFQRAILQFFVKKKNPIRRSGSYKFNLN